MLDKIMKTDEQYYMNTFGTRLPAVFERGEGVRLYDTDGNEYYDFLGGIAVNVLGHNHKALVNAISEQAKKMIHVCNYYYTESQAELAKVLCENSCADKAFFCNSGAEANEGAIKLSRKYHYAKGATDKSEIITMKNSFHGRTITTVAATGQEKFQIPFRPMTETFIHVDINDIEMLKNTITEKTGAIMLELIQGESGVMPLSKEYVKEIRKICDEKDIVLIVDEVQTGIGRTGTLFCYEQYGIEPDIFTLAKALAGGVPVGAVLAKDKFCAFVPGDHGSTFGGNPLACSAALCVLDELLNKGLLEKSKETAEYLKNELDNLKSCYDIIENVRGAGLMLGIVFKKDISKEMFKKMFEHKVLVSAVSTNVMRLVPPLIITKSDIDVFVARLKEVLDEYK